MYAFAGAGVPKRGKNTVPFFTARGAALAWWEERMLRTPTDAAAAAAAARFRGEIERDRAEIAGDADGGSEVGEGVAVAVRGLRLWREPTTTTTSSGRAARRPRRGCGYRGVSEVKADGCAGRAYEARDGRESVGVYGTAIEAAYALACALRSRGIVLHDADDANTDPREMQSQIGAGAGGVVGSPLKKPPPSHLQAEELDEGPEKFIQLQQHPAPLQPTAPTHSPQPSPAPHQLQPTLASLEVAAGPRPDLSGDLGGDRDLGGDSGSAIVESGAGGAPVAAVAGDTVGAVAVAPLELVAVDAVSDDDSDDAEEVVAVPDDGFNGISNAATADYSKAGEESAVVTAPSEPLPPPPVPAGESFEPRAEPRPADRANNDAIIDD